jgi:hypothetical protein
MTEVTDIYLIINGKSVQKMKPKDEIRSLKIILK